MSDQPVSVTTPEEIEVEYHPEFIRNYLEYCSIADFVDGKNERVVKYLIPHPSETKNSEDSKTQWAYRCANLHNENLCEPPMLSHLTHMSQEMTFAGLDSETMVEIRADVTGYKKSAVQMYRDVCWHYIVDGLCGIFVDSPPVVGKTLADARSTGERSFQTLFLANSIRNWSHFSSGMLKGKLAMLTLALDPAWIDGKKHERLRIYNLSVKISGDVSENATAEPQYYVTYREVRSKEPKMISDYVERPGGDEPKQYQGYSCNFIKEKFYLIDEGIIDIPEIPFTFFGSGVSESLLKDVWRDNRKTLNMDSVIDNIIYYQGFKRHVAVGLKREDIKGLNESTVATTNSPDANILTFPESDPVAAERKCESIKKKAQRKALLEHYQLLDDTRQIQSAESKSLDMAARKEYYKMTLDMIDENMGRVFRHNGYFEGMTDAQLEKIKISTTRNFKLDDPTIAQNQRTAVSAQARMLGVKSVMGEMLKIDVSETQFVPNKTETNEDIRQRLYEDIDKKIAADVSEDVVDPNTDSAAQQSPFSDMVS